MAEVALTIESEGPNARLVTEGLAIADPAPKKFAQASNLSRVEAASW
jgi:hypothetical protein